MSDLERGPDEAPPPAAPSEPAPAAEAAAPVEAAAEEPVAARPVAAVPPARVALPPRPSLLAERDETVIEVPEPRLRAQSRRDFLLYTAGVAAVAAGAFWLLPDRVRARLLPGGAHDRLDTLAARVGLTREARERTLDRAIGFDDDVAEALYSKDRLVRTYRKQDVTWLRSNYAGRAPTGEFLSNWALNLDGLASGTAERLSLERLQREFAFHEQVTRLVCVEGWSAIAWWGGIRFADVLAKYPPAPGMRWAAMRSDVSVDGRGRPDPYYVSIDVDTALHPQTLLATHFNGRPLPLGHGAPLRLLVPMKLGLKNIKAITHITWVMAEPADYWNQRGYSKYDGI